MHIYAMLYGAECDLHTLSRKTQKKTHDHAHAFKEKFDWMKCVTHMVYMRFMVRESCVWIYAYVCVCVVVFVFIWYLGVCLYLDCHGFLIIHIKTNHMNRTSYYQHIYIAHLPDHIIKMWSWCVPSTLCTPCLHLH